MKLSAPVGRLKQRAKALARKQGIPLHQALDAAARLEGFSSWSLLARSVPEPYSPAEMLRSFPEGELSLLAGRPGQGKTSLGLEVLLEALKSGHRAGFFTLDYNLGDIQDRFQKFGSTLTDFGEQLFLDTSDDINAERIESKTRDWSRGDFVLVDYLQLLDQKRSNPELAIQVASLQAFVAKSKLKMVFISQIDRSFAMSKKRRPTLEDIRLPNPVDLDLFAAKCFLHEGQVWFLGRE